MERLPFSASDGAAEMVTVVGYGAALPDGSAPVGLRTGDYLCEICAPSFSSSGMHG